MFKVPEEFRVTANSPMKSDSSYKNNGYFIIPFRDVKKRNALFNIIASDGAGWEHVSVYVSYVGRGVRTPSWDEMCKVKDIFWSEEDAVVQFHPPKKDYVNHHPSTLHLWKSTEEEFKLPSPALVGMVKKS